MCLSSTQAITYTISKESLCSSFLHVCYIDDVLVESPLGDITEPSSSPSQILTQQHQSHTAEHPPPAPPNVVKGNAKGQFSCIDI